MTATEIFLPILTAPATEVELAVIVEAGKANRLLAIYKIHVARLDNQFGVYLWSCTYKPLGHSITCRLEFEIEGIKVTKSGVAWIPKKGFASQAPDDDPSFIAFVRASQQAGCLRDLTYAFAEQYDQPEPDDREEPWDPPLAGPTFFPWVSKYGKHFKVDVMTVVNKQAMQHGFSSDMRTWDQDQVDRMARFLMAKARKFAGYKGEFDRDY